MGEIYRYEAETLRKIVHQCADILFKYGHTFEKADRDKTIELLAIIKNRKDLDDVYNWMVPKPEVKFEKTKENIHSMIFTDDVVQDRYDKLKEENTKLKELLKECKRQFEEVELYRCDVADTDQEDWFKISTNQANVANKMIAKINQVLGEE